MTNKHLVSVLIPCYNAEKTIEDAINSILIQDYDNIELIVINDGSIDNSLQILEKIQKNDQRLKVYSNDTNIKLIKTLNKGIQLCNGKYIVRMDADDISLKNRISKQVNFMEENTDVVVCGSYMETFGYRIKKTMSVPINHYNIINELFFNSSIYHPTAIIRKSILENMRVSYDEFFPNAEDYKLWYDLSKYGKLANIPEVLVKYRISNTQISKINNLSLVDSTKKIRRLIINDFFASIGLQYNVPKIITLKEIKKVKILLHKLNCPNNLLLNYYLSLDKYSIASFIYYIFSFDFTKFKRNESIRVFLKHFSRKWDKIKPL